MAFLYYCIRYLFFYTPSDNCGSRSTQNVRMHNISISLWGTLSSHTSILFFNDNLHVFILPPYHPYHPYHHSCFPLSYFFIMPTSLSLKLPLKWIIIPVCTVYSCSKICTRLCFVVFCLCHELVDTHASYTHNLWGCFTCTGAIVYRWLRARLQ